MSKICRTFAAENEIAIMKKNYNQPMVEAVEVQAASMLLDASPASTLPVNPTPISGEGD